MTDARAAHRTLAERIRAVPAAVWFALSVAAVLAVAAVGSALAYHNPKAVDWGTVGYAPAGPGRLSVTFQVLKSPAATVTCTVLALAADTTVVGSANVAIGASMTRSVTRTVVVPLSGAAVTGKVDSCRLS